MEKNKVEHESDIAYKGYGMLRSFQWENIVNLAKYLLSKGIDSPLRIQKILLII